MSENEHTSTPWVDKDNDDCTHPAFHDKQFGECRIMSLADYRHALRCVNAHDALLAACRDAFAYLDHRKADAALLGKLAAAILNARGEESAP